MVKKNTPEDVSFKKKTLLLQLAKVCKALYFLLSSFFSPVMSKLFLEQKEDFPIKRKLSCEPSGHTVSLLVFLTGRTAKH